MSKQLKVLVGIVLFALISFSIYQVITSSNELLKDEAANDIKQKPPSNNHAEGQLITEYSFNGVTTDESFDNIIKNNEVTVVNLFASWCNPCRNETPDLNEFYLKDLPDDVELVGLNVQDSSKARDAFIEEFGVQYPIYNMDNDKDFMEGLRLTIIPTTLFINSDGEIVKTYVGEISKKTLDSYIQYVKDE